MRLRSTRAGLSVVVVIAQLAILTHTALVAHTLSSSGAVLETPATAAPHDHGAGSVCAEGRAQVDEACGAVAWTRTSARLAMTVAVVPAPRGTEVAQNVRAHQRAWSRPPLVEAPKSSPPARG